MSELILSMSESNTKVNLGVNIDKCKKILWNNSFKKIYLGNGAALNYSCIREAYKHMCDAVLFDIDCLSLNSQY